MRNLNHFQVLKPESIDFCNLCCSLTREVYRVSKFISQIGKKVNATQVQRTLLKQQHVDAIIWFEWYVAIPTMRCPNDLAGIVLILFDLNAFKAKDKYTIIRNNIIL